MIDFGRTLQLLKGALLDPEPTWRSYLAEAGDWKTTAFLLTGPLIVASVVIGYLIGLVSSDMSLFGIRPTIPSSLLNIILGIVAAGVAAFVFSGLAGAFGGKSDFALGLAATTLAFVPGYVGQALAWLPWIGTLLALGLAIYGLVLLWRILPIYLEVPDTKRAAHYILSLLACLVVMFILGGVTNRILYGSFGGPGMSGVSGMDTSRGGPSGMFGGVARQAELITAAENDRYTPPDDGELSDRQVQEFIRVMDRASEVLADKEDRLRELAEKADRDEDVSLRDLGDMMSGMTEVAGMNTTEIEIVKSAGGNWAEHQWIRESLRTAWLQKDINDTVVHNYALYQKYEQKLANYIGGQP